MARCIVGPEPILLASLKSSFPRNRFEVMLYVMESNKKTASQKNEVFDPDYYKLKRPLLCRMIEGERPEEECHSSAFVATSLILLASCRNFISVSCIVNILPEFAVTC